MGFSVPTKVAIFLLDETKWEEFVEFQTYDSDNVDGLPPFQQMLKKTNTMEKEEQGKLTC